jgi:hypothetical protein
MMSSIFCEISNSEFGVEYLLLKIKPPSSQGHGKNAGRRIAEVFSFSF